MLPPESGDLTHDVVVVEPMVPSSEGWPPPGALPLDLARVPAAGIAIDDRGRAVIAGTTVEAHRIAALLDGGLMDVDEVARDYVSLSRAQVLAAKAYADAHPWTGEPFPRLTAKKAMREADLSELEQHLPIRD